MITSVANPHSNCRAELAVNTVERMLMDNVSGAASLEVDKFQGALLMYRNTVDPETKASPALSLFGVHCVCVCACVCCYFPLRHTNFHSVTRKIKI